ncbi:hypothetical protein DFQ28_003458 [Apophysomyces sp. BC1034]|nr:hypothetical protein DFQ30_003841 [Apophysomyces sp. BC1015]KAG0178891.1 hypothetical protein DFQ29_002873 [Apophysomyces sp. BC1021]KAG0189409.1 hypothetical protein DFQ28_003458 [Apophysomyces sp. BC1034]
MSLPANPSSSLRPRRTTPDLTDDLAEYNEERAKLHPEEERLLGQEESELGDKLWDDNDTDRRSHAKSSYLPYILLGLCIGGFFLVFKILVLKFGHDPSHYTRGAEKLYNNGTHYFGPTVILISLDGFRNDYLERNITPHLAQFASEGVRAKYMNPSFPSITFPNHWTLVTGLYPEAHGIVGNDFYDPEMGESFIHKIPRISEQSKWWGGEPIWTTSTRQGKRSATIMWPGSDVPIQSVKPDFTVNYKRETTIKDKMDQTLAFLDLPKEDRPQMISIYIPQADQKGHGAGPDGPKIDVVLSDMDKAIGYLMEGLKERKLDPFVHVVIVSDHGMAATHRSRLIFYDDILSKESLSFLRQREAWPLLSLRPKDDAPEHAAQQAYEELHNYVQSVDDPHFQVYLREDIPARFHYNTTKRIAPVVAIPDVGYSFATHDGHDDSFDLSQDKDYRPRGMHGYDNMAVDMRAIFMAKGPAIDYYYGRGSVVEPFVNVELYAFVAKLLNLKPAPNNGTLHGQFRKAL